MATLLRVRSGALSGYIDRHSSFSFHAFTMALLYATSVPQAARGKAHRHCLHFYFYSSLYYSQVFLFDIITYDIIATQAIYSGYEQRVLTMYELDEYSAPLPSTVKVNIEREMKRWITSTL